MPNYNVLKKCYRHFTDREITFTSLLETEIREKGDKSIIQHYKQVIKEAREISHELLKILEMN